MYTQETQNNYSYFTKVELQLQINDVIHALGLPSITRIIAEINFVAFDFEP